MSDQVQLEHPLLGPSQRIWVTSKQAEIKAKSGWVEVGESDSTTEDSQDLEEADYDLGEPSTEEE